jgi:hypothetical protein
VAEELLEDHDILKHLILSLSSKSPFDQRVAAYVIHSMTKHDAQIAVGVVNNESSTGGSLNTVGALIDCIDAKDTSVKEMGCWAISTICSHTAAMAKLFVDA